MSFMRPEARAALWRWREALVGAGLLAIGLWWALTAIGLLYWLGYVLLVLAIAILAAGLQRARFRAGSGGPGVVRVDEGQVAYFGPLTGGVVAMGDLAALKLDPRARPAHWILSQPGQPDLAIPLTAEGADTLFDAFATLPGIRTEHMLAQMRRASGQVVVIWQKPQTTVARPRLH
ncbi:hypothetical protein [uncultured Roseovarius sp.]|uniref:hypothetical protein n=1 Tax=Roseovarius sp. TaxID=1486281 RepID=UPI0025E2FD26|nr:hypothetical protein [uncultured Roseovarius sp.]